MSHFELESRPVDTASLRLVAEDGRTVSLADWRGQPVLLVFLRWLGWLPCLEHLAQLREQRAKLEGRGVHVLAVAFESAEQVGDFVARDKPGFPVLRDPERAAYRAFGFGRPGALRIWAPRTLAFYARKLLRGQLPRHFQSDPFQLGGDVLVGPEGSPCWVYRSDEPADRPSVDSILQVLERLMPR